MQLTKRTWLCWNPRNWTIGVCWDSEDVTFCLGPVGLIVGRE